MTTLLTAEEVARALRVDTATVYRWAQLGRLPAVRLSPKVVRFKPEDVDAFVEGSHG